MSDSDYALVQTICKDRGLEQFTLGQLDDLVTLCQEFAKCKISHAVEQDSMMKDALRRGWVMKWVVGHPEPVWVKEPK